MSETVKRAVVPANTHGTDPAFVQGAEGGLSGLWVRVPDGEMYRPPEGWAIDSIFAGKHSETTVRVTREDDR